jgi:hypothetical protein
MRRHPPLVLGLLAMAVPALAQTPAPAPASTARPQVVAFRVTTPPIIDGSLDDDAWTQAPIPTTEWGSYNPLHGDHIPQHTTVWVGYDDAYFYFAFKCDDPDPGGIKTSISRRDNVWNDDWVGLSLDSLGTGQLSYHMMVNPSGIQMDLLNSIAAGEDQSPDWIWDSAGRRTDTGYSVEIRLPLQSIRFKGGQNIHMGILFWRRVSRTGVSVSWPALEPGKWVFEKNAMLVVPELKARPPRELIPTTTYSRDVTKQAPGQWDASDTGEVGLSAKVGLSSTITLDATVNPDFSQVESDAFQVQVNQRFPVYFPEKRPFFMEGAGIFTLAGTLNGDQSFFSAVNTRNIVDPIAGMKLTGNIGRLTFATLTAVDQDPGPTELPDGVPPGDRTFNVVRAEYSLRPGSYVGVIATDTERPDGFNRTVGADVSFRPTSNQSVTAFAIETASRAPGATNTTSGAGGQLRYQYTRKTWTFASHFEHYDRAFEMDTAFINRVGDTNGWVYGEYNIYPDKDKWPWLRRIQPFTFNQATDDQVQDGSEFTSVNGVRMYFSRQGFFRFDELFGHEPWAGERFRSRRWRIQSNAQLFRWMSFYMNANAGLAVFYDPEEPYQGNSSDVSTGVTLQPNGRFSQEIGLERVEFDRESTGERVYTVKLVNTKTTYQFTNHFFVRAIVQYDSSQYRVLTDFLSSYELRPGTVFYAGYGSLIEQRDYRDNQWVSGMGAYQPTQRGLFLKASYLYRF